MTTLAYNNAAFPVRFNLPRSWDPAELTSLKLTIRDEDATALLNESSVTLYTDTSLDAAVDRYSSSFQLDSGADDLKPGDRIKLVGVVGEETVTVKGYDSSNQTVTIEGILDNEYEAGDDVYGLFGDIELDLSDTDDFPNGIKLWLEWIPAGTGAPLTQEAEVADIHQLYTATFEIEFEAIYSRAYDGLIKPKNRLPSVYSAAMRRLRSDLLESNLDVNRVMDSDLLTPALCAQCAVIWCLNGDDSTEDEMTKYQDQYESELGLLRVVPIWVDENGDKIRDGGELKDHPPIFHKGW